MSLRRSLLTIFTRLLCPQSVEVIVGAREALGKLPVRLSIAD